MADQIVGDEKKEWELRLKGRAEAAFNAAAGKPPPNKSRERERDTTERRPPDPPQMHLRPKGAMRAAGDAIGRLERAKEAHRLAKETREAQRTDRNSFTMSDLAKAPTAFDKGNDKTWKR